MKSPWRAAVLIFLVAALLRVVYAAQLQPTGYLDYPLVDAETFVNKAIDLAFTSWWGEGRAYYHEPLYLYLMALLFRLFGYGLYPAYAFNFLCGCVTAVLTFVLARQLLPGRERLAVLAGLAAAACGPLLFFEGQLLREALATCLALAAFVLFWRGKDSPNRPWALAVGLLIGLATATRGSMFTLFPVCLIFLLWRRPNNWAAGAVWLLLGAILALAPIAVRNGIIDTEPIFLASSWGLNLYLGNNADADATLAIRPGFAWEDLCAWPDRASGTALGTIGRQKFYVAEVERWAIAHPLGFLRLQFIKLFRFLRGYEQMRNVDPYFVAERVPLLDILLWRRAGLSFPTGLIMPFALVGLVALRSRWRELAPYTGLLALFTLSVIVFFVVSRYRAPILPFLLPAAVAGADAVWSALRARRWPLPLAALALLALSNLPFPGELSANEGVNCIRQERINYAEGYRQLGDIEVRRGYPLLALENYHRGSADPAVHLKWAGILHRLGRFDRAETEYRAVLAAAPDLSVARENLAQLARDRGTENELRASIAGRKPTLDDVRRALDRHQPMLAGHWLAEVTADSRPRYDNTGTLDPGTPGREMTADATVPYIEIWYQTGCYPVAALHATRAIAQWPDDYRFWLARSWARFGYEDYRGAGDDLRRALALAPDNHLVQMAVQQIQAKGGIWPPLLVEPEPVEMPDTFPEEYHDDHQHTAF